VKRKQKPFKLAGGGSSAVAGAVVMRGNQGHSHPSVATPSRPQGKRVAVPHLRAAGCWWLDQFDQDAAAYYGGGALESGESDIAFGIEEAVYLGAAGFQERGHFVFGDFLPFHGFVKLPGYDFLDGLSLGFFEDAFLLQEIVNACAHVGFAMFALGGHCCSSFWRWRARASFLTAALSSYVLYMVLVYRKMSNRKASEELQRLNSLRKKGKGGASAPPQVVPFLLGL
jgi:hypothetical protein